MQCAASLQVVIRQGNETVRPLRAHPRESISSFGHWLWHARPYPDLDADEVPARADAAPTVPIARSDRPPAGRYRRPWRQETLTTNNREADETTEHFAHQGRSVSIMGASAISSSGHTGTIADVFFGIPSACRWSPMRSAARAVVKMPQRIP
jgi:hypothetical protein